MSISATNLATVDPSPSADFPVEITTNALKKVLSFAAGNPDFEGKSFRVHIQDGGCAGLRYTFVFDDPAPDDHQTTLDGIHVAIDPQSMNYLKGSKVDYVETLDGAGFTVVNPNAQKTCGCGSSFGGC